MRAVSTLLFALTSIASLALPASVGAHDRTDPGQRARWLAEADVVSLTTLNLQDGWRVRAIVLETGANTSLVVESRSPRGRVGRQLELATLLVLGRHLRMDQVEQISRVAFVREGLTFDASFDQRTVACLLPLERNGLPRANIAQCNQGDWDDPAHNPPQPVAPPDVVRPRPPLPPERPHWARLPAVIQACGDAFTGQQNELACLDKADSFRSDPTAAIRACESYTTGDTSALACLGTVDRVFGDPTQLIAACESYTTGDANLMRCTAEVQQLSYPTNDVPAVIAACESATTGDENMLRCLGAVRDIRGGAAATLQLIRACEEAMSGDDATITCISRG